MLYEANPVGAPTTHFVSTLGSSFQISDTFCLIASIRKDLPWYHLLHLQKCIIV